MHVNYIIFVRLSKPCVCYFFVPLDACSCFKNAWKVHSQKHVILCHKKRFDDGDAVLDEVELEGAEELDGRESSRSTGSWVLIRSDDDKVFFPSNFDVGCCLKVDIRAVSTVDGTVLAGPMVAFTEPVLSAPHAPPKRSLAAVPGAVQGISGSLRFRILSYNILAELYATKQVLPIVLTAVTYLTSLLFSFR
jgi:CCR4-NOT transcription complex subunit 6